MKRTNLLTGAAMLTVTGFLLRGLGMLLRVYISAGLGEEGMGLYQLAQSVYFLFITVAQSGISVALTRVLSSRLAVGDRAGAQSAVRSAIRMSLTLGTAAGIAMCALSYPICRYWVGDMRCVAPIAALSAALPFIALCGVLSAYFIVLSRPVFGCISQLIEQGVRIALALAIKPLTLTAVSVSGSIAEALSCLFLVICYLFYRERVKTGGCVRELTRVAVPVAASRYLASLLRTVENILVPNAVAVFTGSRAEALAQFGALKGMALPLLFFPYSILSAVTTLLVPRLTSAQAVGDKAALARTAERVCSLTLTLSVAAAGVFFTFARPLGQIIYSSSRVSVLVLWLSFIVPFMYLDSVCDGFLKGLGKQKQVLLHNSIDSAGRILLVCVFVPHLGIAGFVGVMVLSNVAVSLMNFFTLCKTAGLKFGIFGRLAPPTAVAAASSFLTKFFFKNSATALNTAVGAAVFCMIFAVFYLVFELVRKKCKN